MFQRKGEGCYVMWLMNLVSSSWVTCEGEEGKDGDKQPAKFWKENYSSLKMSNFNPNEGALQNGIPG